MKEFINNSLKDLISKFPYLNTDEFKTEFNLSIQKNSNRLNVEFTLDKELLEQASEDFFEEYIKKILIKDLINELIDIVKIKKSFSNENIKCVAYINVIK